MVRFVWTLPAELQGQELYPIVIRVDDPGDGSNVNNECDESNNSLTATIECKSIN